ncbi:Synaptic vesicle 2-related protein-like [Oopsacas minuta]|uniref:Synaptic vesicle 2-related protein-like n=1 Tax=Oopsacas minuta TaxID=111878 RepID=A0AAV7JD94_9METZ|nr:Synaptic vesicle 2-related protein-like [Oopsacas minuta]
MDAETSFTTAKQEQLDDEGAQLLGQEGVEQDKYPKEYTVDAAIKKIGLGLFQLNAFNFAGTIWAVHSGVALHSAVLSASWQCEFGLSNSELALITTMYPIGSAVGSNIYGILADRYGRKKVINIANYFVMLFGILSAIVPNYGWLLTTRFLIGMLIISGNQVTTYCVEFMPVRYRSPAIMLLNIYWTIGLCLTMLLSYLVIPNLGWRYFAFLSCLPIAMSMVYYWFAPTSPRYLIKKGSVSEAEKVLKRGARMNRKSLPKGELVSDEVTKEGHTQGSKNRLKTQLKQSLQIFNRKHIFTTLILSLIWFTSGFIYYGAVLITQDIFIYDTHCQDATSNTSITRTLCHPLTLSDYSAILITTFAELPGIIITIFILELIGRKLTFCLEFILSGAPFFFLYICTSHDRIVKTIALFVTRGSITAVFLVAFLYTSEVYPTEIRGTSLAILSTVARFAVIISSFVSQVLLREQFLLTIGIFGAMGVATGVASLFLPVETKGRNIK